MDKIKSRIQKLLSHAKGTSNEAEAESYLAAATALMQEYQLSSIDLIEQEDKVVQAEVHKASKTSHAWHRKLWYALGAYYGCDNVWYKNGTTITSHLVGRKSAIVTTELMYPFVRKQILAQGRAHAEVSGMSVAGATKRVATAVLYRIHCLTTVEPTPETPAGKSALVTLDAVEAFMDEHHKDLKVHKSRRSVVDAAAYKLAEEVSLHRQTEGAQAAITQD